MQRRIVPRFLALIVVAFIVQDCPMPETVAPLKPTATEVVVTVEPSVEVHLVGWASTGLAGDLQRELLDQCPVTYDLVETGDYRDTLQALFAAGEEFDILYMDTVDFPLFAESGFLAPVDDSPAIRLDEFTETLVGAFTTFEGTTYGVPRDFSTLALFYNRDLFAKAGVDEPNNDWTWGDLEEAAWLITDYTGVPGFSVPPTASRFSVFVLQNGGRIMNEDYSDTWIDSPEAVEAGKFYTDALWAGWATIPKDLGLEWQGEAFGRGDVAMVLEGFWMISYLSEQFPDLDYGAVHPPSGPAGEGNLIFGTAYAVSANSSAPQAALQTIDCLTSEKAQSLILESGVALPSRRSFEGHPYLEDNPVANAIFTGIEFANPYGWGPHHGEVDGAITDALMRVYYEGWGVEESLWQAAEDIRIIIGQ
jgi:multiple sugar transport system substrate-binding protein